MTLMAFMLLCLKKLAKANSFLAAALSFAAFFLPGFASAAELSQPGLLPTTAPAPTAASTPATPAGAAPWNPEGEKFESYQVFKDELFAALGKAQRRVAVVSMLLSDGDIATALYIAKIRGIIVTVVLDTRESRKIFSRHEYLARTGVPTYFRKLAGLDMGGLTTVVIDDTAWRLDSRLDDKNSGAVRIDRAATTADEVFAWSSGPDVQQAVFHAPAPQPPGANTSTRLRRRTKTASDTISDENRKQSGASIPRRLPRETRAQRMRDSGTRSSPQSSGSPGEERLVKVPAPPANESDLTE